MSNLGTKSKPARIRVQTEERAMELLALCTGKGWQLVVGIEPDVPEDISDITKLMNGTIDSLKLTAGTARNAPCPCGSGKQYKRCCGK
jgi:SWIM/SEC-C metal-binding protein